eukprot:TRINITY_DN4445_c0_g1_i1.p1 TRINITY_DN4445_c0_g1~~TRINITY_DN4445_c0_g1_i1.p1  ORF type:complete len:747 (+),score=137.12 TRINITY_DN4445_c0_g1_i1:154-2394(+)
MSEKYGQYEPIQDNNNNNNATHHVSLEHFPSPTSSPPSTITRNYQEYAASNPTSPQTSSKHISSRARSKSMDPLPDLSPSLTVNAQSPYHYTHFNRGSLEAQKEAMNYMFGTKKFKSHISKRKIEERSPQVQQLYKATPAKMEWSWSPGHTLGNILWLLVFGWLFFVIYAIVGLFLHLTFVGIPYGRMCWKLAEYFLWPFGKYLERLPSRPNAWWGDGILGSVGWRKSARQSGEHSPFLSDEKDDQPAIPLKDKVGYIFWITIAVPLLVMIHVISFMLCWLFVVFIPMAKVNREMIRLFGSNPLTLNVVKDYPRPGADILLYTNHAFNVFYYKYTVGGLNVVLVNLLPFVLLSIFFGYFLDDYIHPAITFACCLLSTIPLSYYNGMAIASLSAQTTFAVGALINASFGSMIELILYVVTIHGKMESVATSALTGALLGALLLIPGVSMILGGVRYKEQHFSPAVAGVSSILLIISVVGAFTPTIFYRLYGSFTMTCTAMTVSHNTTSPGGEIITSYGCHQSQPDLDNDPVYTGYARTLMFICAGILPVSYFVGLLFTLKTHRDILYEKPHGDAEEGEGNDEAETEEQSAEWSKLQCIIVLLGCTTMFALISQKLVQGIGPVVEVLGLSPSFLGVTLLAIIPSAAEYLNAVQFALYNNMPLALEIGASSAVQITLFQMPVLVFISAVMNHLSADNSFTLIFPLMDFYFIFFSVLILNLIYSNGKTNYFIGCALVVIYFIIISSFYFL